MSQTVQAVFVGCGSITQAWLKAIQTMKEAEEIDLEIVGMVDLVEEAARERAKQFGLDDVVIGTDMGAVLQQTNPDVVFNCTIPAAHRQVTIQALEAGCHVLSEKPLADTMANAQAMIAAAEKAGKIFAVIQNRRYDPRIRRLRHLVETEAVGPLTTANCDFYIGAHFGGFRDRMEHVLLLDMAIHTFDAARFITGADPATVYCQEWNPAGSWYDHDASAIAIYEMTNGMVYTYRGSWCAEGLNTTWECDWRLLGQKGTILWDGGDDIRAEAVSKAGGFFSEQGVVTVPEFDAGNKRGSHGGVIREFVECVQTGGVPETICTDNVKSLAMVLGAIESAETGRKVDITY